MEKLQIDKQEVEMTIQELHKTADNLESLRDDSKDEVVKLKTNQFIKEIEKEIDWNEQVLEDINSSLEFLRC